MTSSRRRRLLIRTWGTRFVREYTLTARRSIRLPRCAGSPERRDEPRAPTPPPGRGSRSGAGSQRRRAPAAGPAARRHVIVDEYQDVNPAQAAFVHALTTPKGPGPGGEGAILIGVGDDWQAIFGFQGSDASLIRTTADPAGVVRTLCEPITLVNGYRFGQGLADASRAVVTMDPKAPRPAAPRPRAGAGWRGAASVGHLGEPHAGPRGRARADLDADDGSRAGRLRVLDTGAQGGNRGGGGRASSPCS